MAHYFLPLGKKGDMVDIILLGRTMFLSLIKSVTITCMCAYATVEGSGDQ